jgi:hypothetical protein
MRMVGCRWTSYSSHQIGRFGAEMLQWSGARKETIIHGSGLGFFDRCWGHGWVSLNGVPTGDIIANASGTALYVSGAVMEWTTHHSKIFLSYNQYARYRPNVLGHSFSEQLLKDYNGQTYWLSVTYIPS